MILLKMGLGNFLGYELFFSHHEVVYNLFLVSCALASANFFFKVKHRTVVISASLYFIFLAAQCLCLCVFDHIIHSQLVNWQSAIFNHWLFQIANIIVIL